MGHLFEQGGGVLGLTPIYKILYKVVPSQKRVYLNQSFYKICTKISVSLYAKYNGIFILAQAILQAVCPQACPYIKCLFQKRDITQPIIYL